MSRHPGKPTDDEQDAAAEAFYRPICGGATHGPLAGGCGAVLRYESSANGLEYWRCPACGNPHWWPAAALAPKEE